MGNQKQVMETAKGMLRVCGVLGLALLGACAPEATEQVPQLQENNPSAGIEVPVSEASLLAAPEARLEFGEPGVLRVIGQGAFSRFPTPAEPRHFRDRAEFIEFVHTHLNGKPTTDAVTGEKGIELQTTGGGRTYLWDQTSNQAVLVRDFGAAYLGGRFGEFYIGNDRLPLRDERPRELNVVSVSTTTSSGFFKLEGLTSITHIGFYHNAGTDSRDQSTGAKDPNRSLSVSWTWLGSGFFQTGSQTLIGQDFATGTISEWFTCNSACKITCNRGSHSLTDTMTLFSSPLFTSTSEPSGC